MALLDDLDADRLEALFAELEDEAAESVRRQGVAAGDVVLERQIELRYLGQEHALPVAVGDDDRAGRAAQGVRGAAPRPLRPRHGQPPAGAQRAGARRSAAPSGRRSCPSCPPGDGDPCTGADVGSRGGVRLRHPGDGRRSPCTTAPRLAPGDVLTRAGADRRGHLDDGRAQRPAASRSTSTATCS